LELEDEHLVSFLSVGRGGDMLSSRRKFVCFYGPAHKKCFDMNMTSADKLVNLDIRRIF
jgi:hypothetical protein